MAKDRGLYKRGRIWWLRYAGPDGRIIYESSRTTDYREARALLVQRRQAVLEGTLPVRLRPTILFAELAEEYRHWAQRQRSFLSNKRYLIAQLVEAFGPIPLSALTVRLVETYQSRLLAAGKAPATVNRRLATLKHMVHKAVEWDLVGEEVYHRLRRVRPLPEQNRRLRYLTPEECQRLVEACDAHLRPIVLVALHTGMRKGEILSLEWERHIDLRQRLILLDRTKSGRRREIPMNSVVYETLQAIPRRLDSPYVFTDAQGRRFRDIKRSFRSACRRAGIRDFRFHDLRHTFASHLVMAGADLRTVQELLGHQSLTMTLRYAHLSPGHKRQAVAHLEGQLYNYYTIREKTGEGK